MKKIYLLIATMLFGMNCTMQAQTENELIVTNQEGEQEVIELPEGMTQDSTPCSTNTTPSDICSATPLATIAT